MSIRTLCACVLGGLLTSFASAQPPPLAAPVRFPADDAPPSLLYRNTDGPGGGPLPILNDFGRSPLVEAPPAADAAPAGPFRIWMNNELLMWWMEGMGLPNLVTSSPAGTPVATAGVIGQPGTVTVFPKGTVDNSMRFGWRSTMGGWLDDDQRFALEAQFLLLAGGGKQFSAASDGTLILVRPVINGVTNVQTSEPIAVPGTSAGAIHIATSTSLIGAGLWVRERFCSSDDPCSTCRPCLGGGCSALGCSGDSGSAWRCRFDGMFGYRYLRLGDHLAINDTVTAAVALNGLPAGAQMQRLDKFDSDNTFHGLDVGITGAIERGPWSLGVVTKVAAGANDSSVDILGARVVNGVATPSGLLAQTTNGGHFSKVHVSGVPEIDLKLAYALGPNVRLYFDYTLLYWFNVYRAGAQADVNVDPSFLLLGAPTGNAAVRPAISLQGRDMWVQGISIGLEWRY